MFYTDIFNLQLLLKLPKLFFFMERFCYPLGDAAHKDGVYLTTLKDQNWTVSNIAGNSSAYFIKTGVIFPTQDHSMGVW